MSNVVAIGSFIFKREGSDEKTEVLNNQLVIGEVSELEPSLKDGVNESSMTFTYQDGNLGKVVWTVVVSIDSSEAPTLEFDFSSDNLNIIENNISFELVN